MQVFTYGGFQIEKQNNICRQRWIAGGSSRNLDFEFRAAAAAGESGYSMEFDVPFPSDYDELLKQVCVFM